MTGRCVRSSVGPGFNSVESFFFFFFFFSSSFFFSSPLSPQLAFLFFPSFFCPPLIFSSPFPLLFFLFYFYYSFPIRFLSFLLLVSPFLLLFFLYYFIFLISSSFSSPLSFSFFFFFFRSQNDDFLWFVYSYDRSNWILTDQTGFWSTILADYVFCLILYTVTRMCLCYNKDTTLWVRYL